MSVVTLFDPWKDPLCTCPLKYTCSPYVGCGHGCLYCYISSYIPRAFEPRPKREFIKRLVRDLRRVNPELPISMANSSDPYTPPEERVHLMREALRLLVMRGYKIQIITKSILVLRDLDIIRKGNVAISVTITTLDERLASKLEPGAPSPVHRLKALSILSRSDIPCILRLDPLLPSLNCDEKQIRELVKKAAEAGVMHIVASTYKARPDSLARLRKAFPMLAEEYYELYKVRGVRMKRTVWYLEERLRRELLKIVREAALDEGLTFATCREGMSDLNVSPTCDGTHLIPVRRKARLLL